MRKACVGESGVDEKYIDQSKNGNLPDVPELRCYVLCMFEHFGVIEPNSTIHFEKIMHLLPDNNKETVQLVYDSCSTKRKRTLSI